MRNETSIQGEVSIVGDTCTLYPARRLRPIVARVLGRRQIEGGEEVWLDRLVHERHHATFCGCAVSGAVTTILVVPRSVV